MIEKTKSIMVWNSIWQSYSRHNSWLPIVETDAATWRDSSVQQVAYLHSIFKSCLIGLELIQHHFLTWKGYTLVCLIVGFFVIPLTLFVKLQDDFCSFLFTQLSRVNILLIAYSIANFDIYITASVLGWK